MFNLRNIPRSWIFAAASIVVLAYLIVASVAGSRMAENRLCTGVKIVVHDTASLKFVTPQELLVELGDLPARAIKTPVSSINIDSLERALARFDKIESVAVNLLSSGELQIDVHPMRPVARIFDSADGSSYYINRQGKRIAADARYHLDVPVVTGDFSTPAIKPTSIIPLVDFIGSDSTWNAYVSMIKVDSPTDIIVVPNIRGHVVNFGDTLDFSAKFERLRRFYAEVAPVKGWECYDTLSLKWQSQVVGHRRIADLAEARVVVEAVNAEDADVTAVHIDKPSRPDSTSVKSPISTDSITPTP